MLLHSVTNSLWRRLISFGILFFFFGSHGEQRMHECLSVESMLYEWSLGAIEEKCLLQSFYQKEKMKSKEETLMLTNVGTKSGTWDGIGEYILSRELTLNQMYFPRLSVYNYVCSLSPCSFSSGSLISVLFPVFLTKE